MKKHKNMNEYNHINEDSSRNTSFCKARISWRNTRVHADFQNITY